MPKSISWPLPKAYSRAIQNPQNCFNEPELKAGRVKTNRLGPVGACGSFAIVYQLQSNAKNFAVRCFIRPVTSQQQRYELLSQHLSKFSVETLVDFTYLPQGIRVSGQWYPVVRMEWISGKQLHNYVMDHLKQPQVLGRLAARWRGVVSGLRGARTAHGDLQHGNILVDSQGQMRLVDYDGFFIPALQGQPPDEVGHPNYQHPERIQRGYYQENADDFSALVIYLSLLAIKADPGLWKTFHNGQNLIFSDDDFKNSGQTPLWNQLKKSPDAEVQQLTGELENFCGQPVSAVLDLEEVLQGLRYAGPQPTTPAAVQGGIKSSQTVTSGSAQTGMLASSASLPMKPRAVGGQAATSIISQSTGTVTSKVIPGVTPTLTTVKKPTHGYTTQATPITAAIAAFIRESQFQ